MLHLPWDSSRITYGLSLGNYYELLWLIWSLKCLFFAQPCAILIVHAMGRCQGGWVGWMVFRREVEREWIRKRWNERWEYIWAKVEEIASCTSDTERESISCELSNSRWTCCCWRGEIVSLNLLALAVCCRHSRHVKSSTTEEFCKVPLPASGGEVVRMGKYE